MTVIDVGTGPPVVLIPGIQGRWEWMRPAVAALSRSFRVITFSLTRLPDRRVTGAAEAFDLLVGQVDRAVADAGEERAVVCGVSFGGLVAVRFAAKHPARVSALVLASTPSPSWRPDARVRRYARSPWASAPAFLLGAPRRLLGEIAAARPGAGDRARTLAAYVWTVLTAPASPGQMARRVRSADGRDFVAEARSVRAPTLVLTGEPRLDRVVPVAGTREYLSLIEGAVGLTLERTGHIGLVTRPEAFADAIRGFVCGKTGPKREA